jgi:hypothetical protein
LFAGVRNGTAVTVQASRYKAGITKGDVSEESCTTYSQGGIVCGGRWP